MLVLGLHERSLLTPSRHSFQMAEVAISGQRSRRFADLLRRVENCYHSFQHQRSSGELPAEGWARLASSTRYRFASTAGRHDAPFPTLAQGEHSMIVQILIGVLAMAATLATATAASAHDESKYPDWSGQWRWNAVGGGPRYDPSKPAGAAQQAPLQEEVKRIHEQNMAEQAQGGQGPYPQSAKGIPKGMPFQMSIGPL